MTQTPDELLRIQRRNERLTAAMREFETLSLAVSHDFQAPLAAIDGTARAMGEFLKLDQDARQGVDLIRENVASMRHMIAGLLELVELAAQPLDMEWVDMDALVTQAWHEIADTERIELRREPLARVRGHRHMLKLVWKYLLANAARRSLPRDRPWVHVTGGSSEQYSVYGVRDNGEIAELGYSGKLFYVFEQIQNQSQYSGTGVGLAIVQRVVTRHRGNVWVEARRNEGAFFQFSILTGDAPEAP
jgi:light-regulated signal transduction histidine kinase (bacteriophytochrome)